MITLNSFLKESRYNLKLTLPLMVTTFLQGASGFVATAFLAHSSPAVLTASGIVSGLFMTFITLYWGIISGVGVLIAQYASAKNLYNINLTIMQGIFLAITIAIPSWLIMWGVGHLLFLTKQPATIIHLALLYLHAASWSLFPLAVLFVFEQFLVGLSRTRIVMVINLLQIPAEMLLCYLFIFGKWGLPKLGISGVGYAYTVVFILAAIIIMIYFFFSKTLKPYLNNPKAYLFHPGCFLELVKVGFPVGAMFCIETAAFVAIAFLMARISSAAVAGYQVTLQFTDISLMLIYAFAQITTVRVSNMIGDNNKPGIKLATSAGMSLCILFTIGLAIIYFYFPHIFIAIDLSSNQTNQPIINIAISFFPIMGIFLIAESLRVTIYSVLRGIKDTRYPMVVSLVTFWGIAVFFGLFLAKNTGLHASGLWWGTVLASLVAALLLINRFYKQYQQLDCNKVLKQF